MPGVFGDGRDGKAYRTPPALYGLKIGFFAGLIWGAIRWLMVAMNFTQVPAAFLVDPWVKRSALTNVYWQIAGFALFILMSMAAALIYFILFKPFRGPIPGMVFGVGWWGGLYLAVGPIIGAIPPLKSLSWNTFITDLCLFLAWGLFIGFSIAFEYHDEAGREPQAAGR